jgi:hypothetical protein
MQALLRWLPVFLFGQAIETPIYAVALRARGWAWPRRLVAAFGATALTHPITWFVLPRLLAPYWLMAVASELFAIVVEALYLQALGVRRALGWAVLANCLSCGLGLVSSVYLGWP